MNDDFPRITVSPYFVVKYEALKGLTPYYFTGATEEEARAALQAWLDKKAANNAPSEADNEAETASGRGAGFAGKVWMIHKTKRLRQRVEPSEVDNYLAQGYIKGGPRTQYD